ncbi:alpha/beta hydrolase [Campylobacter sp. TTU_617]|uniref:alpha/beta hydrolase n=1 Tax=Campylobacter sp. TTU_617 TaxID=2768148 RepID=UPI0019030647|nr:alpha/beta hydrolase [Campylobacter sp. TTU_617]MBK1972339.1 alpha/beta hydrolase [Campylobacter sp. TTU_617]
MKKLILFFIFLNFCFGQDVGLFGYTKGVRVIEVKLKDIRIDSIENIVYSQVPTNGSIRGLHMSLLIPQTNVLKPAILYFPGGGFMSANYFKYSQMRMALAKAGFVVASVEYRVIPDKFPALVVDAKSAIRYLRAHAKEYGIDPMKIGVLGDSAGGYLAQMVGMADDKSFEQGEYLDKDSKVQAVATIYGISNLLNIGEGFSKEAQEVHHSLAVTEALLVNGVAFRDFAGLSIQADPKKALFASPLGHIKGKKPPFLIMHGSADTLVSPIQSKQLYEALRKEGNEAEYILIKGANHGDIYWYQDEVINLVVRWFKKNLVSRDKKEIQNSQNLNNNL